MALAFYGIQLLDGSKNTDDNRKGLLPQIFEDANFADAVARQNSWRQAAVHVKLKQSIAEHNDVARWIALALLLVTLMITGIFGWAVLNPPPPELGTSSTGLGAPISASRRFDAGGKSRILRAEIAPRSTDRVAVIVSITDTEQRPVTTSSKPMATLSMVSMAMPSDPIDLVPVGPGVWHGSGTLSMAGRWSLRVDIEGESLQLPFESTLP